MKLNKLFAILPLAMLSTGAMAEEKADKQTTSFQFTTQVSRVVEKDLMTANVFSQKEGKSLPELKRKVSANLNSVIEAAKKFPSIEIVAEGVSNNVTYTDKGKVSGWNAHGNVLLKSKDFDAMAKVLENLGEEVAIQSVDFSISPEAEAKLEDEMTAEVIKQFQHKAEVVKTSLNAKGYRLKDVNLDTPMGGGESNFYRTAPRVASYSMAKMSSDSMPLEAGKATISATATGSVVIEQ